MLAMILHPETQEKGKAELDRVIGSNRLPTINDWDDLPYVTSIVREVIRWHPSVPLCKFFNCIVPLVASKQAAYHSVQESCRR